MCWQTRLVGVFTIQDLWVSQGHIPQKADLARAIDLQYLQAALQRLDGAR